MENNSEILSKINSGDTTLISEAIKTVQENGDFTIAEELLNDLVLVHDDHTITIICNLLADIKDSKFREILISRLQKETDPYFKSIYLRIVWESALDYTPFIDIFVQCLYDEDFKVAFEASTVIENMEHNLNKEQHNLLCNALQSFPAEKHFLIENIIEEINTEEHFEELNENEEK